LIDDSLMYGADYFFQTWRKCEAALIDGSLRREENGAVWVIFGAARSHVPDPDTLNRLYAGEPISPVPTGGVNGISTVPVDGKRPPKSTYSNAPLRRAATLKRPSLSDINIL
jgi:hypothetical protein